jgi:hypothetical protein
LAFLPFLLIGREYTKDFFLMTWPMFLLLVLVLTGFIVFFLANYRLYSLFEREDWHALTSYLESEIYGKGRYTSKKIKLLASSYLLNSDNASVLQLESKTFAAKPGIVDKIALIFGSARILSGNFREAADFFKSRIKKGKTSEQSWIRWFYGFSHVLSGDFSQAEPELIFLAESSGNSIVTGLSAYLLYHNLANYSMNSQICQTAAENGRKRVINSLKNKEGWEKEILKSGNDIHTTIIKKYINETGIWVFL